MAASSGRARTTNGDVESDVVAQGYGSLGLMTGAQLDPGRQDRRGRGRARHGHPALPAAPAGQADLDEPHRLESSPEPAGSSTRGELDGTPEVSRFAETLERVCVQTVEEGKMTKDLALLVGEGTPYLTTEEFLTALSENLAEGDGLKGARDMTRSGKVTVVGAGFYGSTLPHSALPSTTSSMRSC